VIEKIKVESLKQAKDLPIPFGIFSTFGIFSVFHNGKFLTHELMAEKNLINFSTPYGHECFQSVDLFDFLV
jgi:hypothetical protein